MRVANTPEEFPEAYATARKESEIAFGDGTMYIEHFVVNPRHIEFQILADSFGNVIHLGERDCSIQRNHQKMIEESPSAAVSPELREKMGNESALYVENNYEQKKLFQYLKDHRDALINGGE